jgi:predicted TIM-barrel fold metal-dependent hydrolase
VEAAANRYPDLQLEVVHSGMAFLDETFYLLQRFPNVWANLEVTSALAVKTPRRFADAFGRLLSSGARDRIVFASGCCLVHPQPIIESLLAFTMPEDLVEGYGYPQPSDKYLAALMGANYARLHHLDLEEIRRKTAGDEFDKTRHELGARPQPWSRV